MTNTNDSLKMLLKPVVGTAISSSLMYYNTMNFQNSANRSLMFGLAVGSSLLIADVVYNNYIVDQKELKGFSERTVEASLGVIGAVTIDKFLNEENALGMAQSALIVLGSEIASQFVYDYTYGTTNE